MKKIIFTLIIGLSILAGNAFAAPLSIFDNSWTMIVDDDGYDSNGYVDPGWGGQAFDAEYLFYKRVGSVLSIGLQTGFDIDDGKVTAGSKDYYAGDLALSFDGDAGNYEYAFDFGLYTEGYTAGNKIDGGTDTGTDPYGFYSNVTWVNDIYFDGNNNPADSSPFAMGGGTVVAGSDGGTSFGSGTIAGEKSYYRIASFDLSSIAVTGDMDVHWTMSCGNDAIDGTAPVPEPATLILLGSGLAGLAFYRRKKK